MAKIILPWSMVNDTVNDVRANGVHVDDNFNTLLDAVNKKIDVDGSSLMEANLSMNSYKITNLLAGENPGDAINKQQLDDALKNIKVASKSQLGLVKIGDNINVDGNGKISLPIAKNGNETGLITIGRTSTIAEAQKAAVRLSIIQSSVPTSGIDGVIYFVVSA